MYFIICLRDDDLTSFKVSLIFLCTLFSRAQAGGDARHLVSGVLVGEQYIAEEVFPCYDRVRVDVSRFGQC